MTKCVELQETSLKTAIYSLSLMTKYVELQETSFKTVKKNKKTSQMAKYVELQEMTCKTKCLGSVCTIGHALHPPPLLPLLEVNPWGNTATVCWLISNTS